MRLILNQDDITKGLNKGRISFKDLTPLAQAVVILAGRGDIIDRDGRFIQAVFAEERKK